MRMFVALLLVLAASTACGALPADDGKVRVAAGFYPLAYVAQRVGGDLVDVTNLTQPGAEPHDLELTIKETVAIAEADVVVYEKGFQPAVDDGVAQDAEGARLDAGSVAHLQPFADQTDQTDPHFWQDPARLAAVADALATALGRADPAHRATYEANAAHLHRDLATLDHEYAAGLADCERHTIVASHDAFGYLG